MGLYRLNREFPAFLRRAPFHATRAVVSASEAYAVSEHQVDEPEEVRFQFTGVQTCRRTDHSFVWDDTVYQDDEPMKLLNAFQRHLEGIAGDSEMHQARHEILRLIGG